MNIVVNEVAPCKFSVSYEADALKIMNKRGEILNLFKKAPVPGFRAGKASFDAIKAHYRDQIEEALKRALVEDAFHDTLFEKKIKPYGPPKFSSVLMVNGKFSCEFELHTKPDFELASFENLEIPKPHTEVTQEELSQKMLQELRVTYGEVLPYVDTDFVQTGDNVIIDYESSFNGEVIPHLCATGEMLKVGENNLNMITDHLIGMAPGETRECVLKMPEGALPSLAGKEINFKVTLITGSKTIPCPLNDELAKKINMQSFDELIKFVNEAAMGKIANLEKKQLNEAVSLKLLELNNIDVPEWMALSEAQYLAHQSKIDWEVLADLDKEKYIEMAKKNVKLALILDKIRETDVKSQLTDQEVFELIKDNLTRSRVQTSLDEVMKELGRTGMLQILMQRIKDENTLDYVVKTVKVLE